MKAKAVKAKKPDVELYTDGKKFRIKDGITTVVLTKKEMWTVFKTFAPYFNNHEFGIDD